jgi:hypothetical protein
MAARAARPVSDWRVNSYSNNTEAGAGLDAKEVIRARPFKAVFN